MPPRRPPLMELSENDTANSPSNATGNRRKSGRAVRAPEKFVPDAPASQAESTTGKRKRNQDVADDDAENEDIEEEDSEEEDDSDSPDEEEVRESKKRSKPHKKPVAKKPKVNGSAPKRATEDNSHATVARLPVRSKKPKKIAIVDSNATGIYASIFTSGDTSDDVAAEWLRQYEMDNTGAMKDLVNCILKCTGCDLTITEDDINDPDNTPSKLNDLQDEYRDQNVADYPLISKTKSSHAFRNSLTEFFESLIATMHATAVLYDDIALIENIHIWVTTMSSSILRPFRHTATVIALACTTGLCTVARKQAETTAKTLTMLEGEKKKKGANKGRVDTFQAHVDQGNERRDTCENTIRDFFDTVFVHRYRDVDPKIRSDCVEALGKWISALPKIFFEPSYLRYFGWLLSDQHGSTRHEVVKQVEKVMKNKDNIGGLRHFIERFRGRIVEMAARDTELSVRASAVNLLDMIREAGMLEPDDIDTIGKLIFDSEPRVRKAVVDFFVENIKDLFESQVEELGGEETLDEAFTLDDTDPENPCSGWIKLKCVVEVLLAYDADGADESQDQAEQSNIDETLSSAGVESRFSHAAEVLYEKMPEIKDWEMVAGYLLFDHSSTQSTASLSSEMLSSFKLDGKEEAILLEMLITSVKLNLSQPDELEKSKDRPKKKKNFSADASGEQESTARKLANLLPRLLKKFGASPQTAIYVLRLEHVLNLGVFQELRQDTTTYKQLLHEIKSQFKGHADDRVLKEASVALLHAQSFADLEEITVEQMQSLWEDTLEDFRKRFPKSAQTSVRGDLKMSHLLELTYTVTRVSKLAGISNAVEYFEALPVSKRQKKGLGGPRDSMFVIDMLLEIVGRGVLDNADPEIDDEEDRLVSSAVQSALFYFMWKVRSLQRSITASESVTDLDIDQLRERLESFIAKLCGTLSSRAGLDDLRLLATGALLDVHNLVSTFASHKKAGSRPVDDGESYEYLQTLSKHFAPEVQAEVTSIFATAERHYARKAKKALEAPADDDAPEDDDSEPEDEEDDELTDAERQSDVLKAERQLCDLTSKLVLAIYAGVADASGPLKGRLRARITRNRHRLGQNFSKIIAYLDNSSPTGAKKSHKSKAQQDAAAKTAKSVEVIQHEDSDDDPFADLDAEEGSIEDLRRQELLDDDEPISVDEDANVDADVDEESVLGD